MTPQALFVDVPLTPSSPKAAPMFGRLYRSNSIDMSPVKKESQSGDWRKDPFEYELYEIDLTEQEEGPSASSSSSTQTGEAHKPKPNTPVKTPSAMDKLYVSSPGREVQLRVNHKMPIKKSLWNEAQSVIKCLGGNIRQNRSIFSKAVATYLSEQ